MKRLLLWVGLAAVWGMVWVSGVKAEDCDSPGSLSDASVISGCISKYNGISDAIAKANTTNKEELVGLQNQIIRLQGQIKAMDGQLMKLGQDIFDWEVKVGVKEALLGAKVKQDYIRQREQPILLVLFSANTANDFFKDLAYREKLAGQDRQVILEVSGEIKSLNDQSTNLKKQKDSLAGLKDRVDKQATFLAGEVDKANKYVVDLGSKIAALSARQDEILAARSGNFIASVGDSNLADDYNASINGFRESAPSGYFAAFSFGAFTHRKGMSQYGARGRALSRQVYETILKAYYGKEPVKKDTSGDIKVDGFGSMNFEDRYLMGIAEMPSSWPPDALKAQAVAARTYAYRIKTQGGSICTTEACQVFNSGKADNPPPEWKQAVIDTKGEVLEDVVTYYASTHGGYASPIGWDTTNGSGGSNFIDNAYDKIGGSPWLYKAWYTQGYSVSSDKCGRSSPWLSPEEMADIVNAAIALKTGGIDTSRITPVTTSCWGGNPYSMDELKNLVSGNGGISSANSVSVSQGDGNTNNVTINGVSLSGAEFKKAFNLRAPGRLSIPQNGFAFFNIERK